MTRSLNHAPVVLASDGTPASEGALRFAVQEAGVRGAGLVIVHVNTLNVPVAPLRPILPIGPLPATRPTLPSELSVHARRVLDRIAREARALAPGLSVSTVLMDGRRVRAIVDAAADAAQLVVVGRETRHGVERVLTGSTTAGVASAARCPVVVVPGDWSPRQGAGDGPTVVVGLRRVGDAADLMAAAYTWASSRGASITVVHAWQMADSYLDRIETRTHADDWQARGEQLLGEALGTWRDQHPDVSVQTHVVHGHAASVLAAAAKTADLLVVRRAHEHRPWDHLGATVRALLLSSPTPVEVVPAHGGPEPDPDLVLEESGSVTT
jgi:nucleotide-binding universal stress UspA family protein